MHRSLIFGCTAAALAAAVAVVILPTTAQEQNQPAQEQNQPQTEKPEVIALKFHADWCATCRRMGPIFEDLAVVAEEEPVLFTELDLTSRSTRQQAEYLMTLLNLDRVWQQAEPGRRPDSSSWSTSTAANRWHN